MQEAVGSSPTTLTKNNIALVLMVARWIPNPKVRVRIFQAMPNNLRVWYNGCTLAFHVNEDEFDSHYPLQLFSCSLAQLVEHSTDNRAVAGSSPARTTKDLMRIGVNG